jgi:hypothetical protein
MLEQYMQLVGRLLLTPVSVCTIQAVGGHILIVTVWSPLSVRFYYGCPNTSIIVKMYEAVTLPRLLCDHKTLW